MLTQRMLGLLHRRLVATAPRQAGSDEYRTGVEDTIAAVRRLIDAGMPGGLTDTWLAEETEQVAGPDQTHLAAEYLQLEMTSLLSTIDSMLQQPRAARCNDDPKVVSLLDAKAHLVQAREALRQAHGSTTG